MCHGHGHGRDYVCACVYMLLSSSNWHVNYILFGRQRLAHLGVAFCGYFCTKLKRYYVPAYLRALKRPQN